MTTTITLGEFPEDHQWVDDLVLPHVATRAPALVTDAFEFALKARTGVAILGFKGTGKTYSRRRATEALEAREDRRAAADALYRPQRLLTLTTVRAHRPDDVYVKLTQALTNETPELRVRGRQKREDELRADFVYLAHEEGVAGIVLDEGELVRPVVLDVARDIMSDAEELYRARATPAAQNGPSLDPTPGEAAAPPHGPPDRDGSGAYGIGVVLIGTPMLGARLNRTAESGQRWAKTVEVPAPDPATVPGIYTTWFAGFAPAVHAMGERAWRVYVETTVVRDRPVSMRLLDHHAREYVRLMALRDRRLRRLEDVPFDRDVFKFVIDGLDGGNSRGEVG